MLLKYLKIYYTYTRNDMVIIMSYKYKISLLVVAILLAFSMTIGTSYAFWTVTATQTNINKVATGCLEIELNDLDIDGIATNINLPNAYPINDEKGLKTKPYSLTIKNVCSINAKYTIILNALSDSNLTEKDIKYHLIKTSPTETTMTPIILSSVGATALDAEVIEEINLNTDNSIQNSYILDSGVLNSQKENVIDSVTYNLRLWINEDADNSIMGNTFEAAVAVYAEATN